MRNIWAVTRETFLQCARTRIIVVFGVLLAVCVLGIGFKMTGDGTLKGRIQTFLAYSTSLTQLLLCLVTIFLTTSIVTGDIRHKYIFTIASKPLARWQYVLGRWCGVVLLNVLLLAAAMGAIYSLAQYIRKQPTRIEREAAGGIVRQKKKDFDRRGVENEIFTARATYLPEPFNIDKPFEDRMKQIIDERGEDNLIRRHIQKRVPDKAEAEILFSNIDARQRAMAEIRFTLREQILDEVKSVRPGKAVGLVFANLKPAPTDGPLLQVRYKLNPLKPSATILQSIWQVENPQNGFIQFIPRSDSTKTTSSFMVDPRAVTDEGRLNVFYINRQPGVIVKIEPEEITVLQRVAGFEGNFVRAGLLILLRLMFLTAASVLFGVFLSFPITCLSVMIIFVISMTSGFLHDATRLPNKAMPSAYEYFSYLLVKGVFVALPTFSSTSATDSLVDGEYIPWQTLIREYLVTFNRAGPDSGRFWQMIGLKIQTGMGMRTILALAVGWLIFRRRELAGVV
ncbi:MAG: hypothetical protein K8R91_04545 [Phycisphaerae bacterium]|nr:hypothetical protein [Phycisphaerae bacterium]